MPVASWASTGCTALNSGSHTWSGSIDTVGNFTKTSGTPTPTGNATDEIYSVETTGMSFDVGDTIRVTVTLASNMDGWGSISSNGVNFTSVPSRAGMPNGEFNQVSGTTDYVVSTATSTYAIRSKLSTENTNAGAANSSIAITCVAAPVATKLAFQQQPTNAVSQVSITPSITVRILDASNNLVSSSTAQVTLAIANNPGSGTLSGTTTVTASGGVATFTGLSINKVGTGYTLSASSSGLTGATSNAFNITPAAATRFTVSAPASATQGVSFNTLTVTALDAADNVATGYAGTVHFTSTDGAATLPGNSGLTSGTGTFTATLNTTGSRTITATDTVSSSITGTSGAITVSVATPTASNASANAAYSNGSPAVPTNIDLTASVANATYVSPASQPSHGTLNVANGANAAGKVLIYTPTAGYHGSDSFTYRAVASDGSTVSASPATVTVTVADPVLTATISSTGAAAGAPLSGYTITTSGGFGTRTCAAGATAPPAWLTIASNCGLSGTPPSGGTVSFSVNVTDQSTPAYTATNQPVSFSVLSNDADLSNLVIRNGASTVALNTGFTSGTTSYTASVASNVTSVTATPTVNQANATVTVNSVSVTSGSASGAINLGVGTTTITTRVTAQDGVTTKDYVVTVTRATPTPTLTSLSATVANGVGSTTGGGSASTLTLTGSDFTNANQVTFGGTTFTAGNFTISNDTTITLTVPTASSAGVSGVGGTVNVSVSSSAGSSATRSFTYVLTPTINAITSPTADRTPDFSGTAVPGATINISIAGATSVSSSAITADGSGNWTYTASTLNDGSHTAQVTQTLSTVTSGASSQISFDVDATGPAAPIVSTPTENQQTAASVTLSGTTESGTTVEVQIDSGAVVGASVTGTSWTYNATGLATGARTATVVAKDALGNPSTSTVRHFTVVAAPLIGSLSPSSGPETGLNSVTVNGSNLAGATLTVNGASVAIDSNSGSALAFTAPAGTGTVSVVVTTAGGSASTSYTYVAAPTIGSLSPNSGPLAGGAVTLNGTNLTGATLTVGGAGVTINSNSGTVITFTAPSKPAGPATVAVTTAGGTATSTYTYVAGPAISSLSPAGGSTAGLNTVTVNGSNLTGATLTVGGSSVAVDTNSGSALTFTAPAHGAGTVSVVVSTTGGSDSATYTYVAPLAMSPAAGTLPGATANSSYTQTFTASGGTAGYTFTASAGLPTGLTLSTGGVLSGTTTTGGTFNFTVTVTDSSAGVLGSALTNSQSYTVAVSKLGQAITFNTLSNASLSASPLTLSASADSGLAVTFSSTTTGVCTVSGSSLTLLATGTCTVNADQAGDGAYTAAATVSRSFTVTPANLVVTSGAASGTAVGASYSQSNTASGGVAPYNYALASGAFPAGTSLDPSTGAVTGTPVLAGGFNYTVQASDSQGTPVTANGTPVSGTIAKGSQTVSFTSTAPTGAAVGGATYTVSATAGSGLTVVFTLDGSSSGCALSGTTVSFPATGTCVINANQAGDSNWNAAPQAQQSFTVNAAAPIVTTVSFSTGSLGVGQSGTATITFTNSNASASPSIAPLFSGSALVGRGAVGGSCGASGSDSGANFQFNAFSVPAGSCTVTIAYTGVTAGSVSALTLGAFTPAGYPATSAASSGSFVVVPTVTGVSPGSGPVSQVVTVSGTGFSTTPANNIVSFGSAGNGTVTGASATALTVTAPAAGTGAQAVTVTVNGQVSTTSASFTFIARPVAADTTASVPYNSSGTPIDLSSVITGGPHSSIAIVTPVQHGTTSISGDTVTYTPTAGYHGSDSFTYNATGPGGTSDTKQVTITVATPAAPTVSAVSGVAVPYNSTGTTIDLSSAITGVHSSIATSVPSHGTVSIAGDVVTYTPVAGYYGADSFTYTATGPGGTSAPATVSLTVATPAAPVAANKSGVAVPYASTGTAIDLSASITGVHSGIAIGTNPAHGTVSIAGDVVTYTPAATHYGADSFTYTATGPGGTSAPATVSLTVANPPAPVTADKSGVAVPYASTGTAIDLSGSITGVHSGIAIGTNPAHGTVTIAGDVVTYTPAGTYYGADSFTYTATGPGGTSAASTVTLTVATPAAPVAANKSGVAVPYASSGTAIDLSASVTGVHASIAIGTAPAHGTVSIAGDVVTYTPAATYYGADSFTYTATGPGGTSAPATVSLTVATPAAPVAANKSGVAVPYASTGTAIDLSASITGVHSSIAIGTAPAHGTVSIAGDVVTYTPAATYYGADSFTYTATGPGGTSPAATVSLTVATPPAPVTADKSGVAVPYASAGTAIDLSGSITGVRSAIAIGTAPAHGTVTVAGEVVTYTPAATYYGADSFTYTATGPGGTSAASTVSLTVATPAAPTAANKSGVSVAYNSAGTAIDLAPSITGVHSTLTVSSAPAHGTTTVSGDVVTYKPTTGYFGADSFAYTVTGPGGTSAAATVSLTVATPPPPVAAPGTGSVAGSTTTAGTSVNIDLSALVTGVYDTIQISTPPAHGTVTLSGGGSSAKPAGDAAPATPIIATYTPAVNYAGTDSFAFVAVGPGGTSAPGTVTITVVGQVPIAAPKTATTGDGQMVSVMLTDGAARGPFTGANVVSVLPANSASTAIVATGSGGYRLDVTPNNRFGGTIVVTYTLNNVYGTSAPSTVTLTVQARPDPRTDPNVGAISDAQSEAARRFARAQVSNFMRRTEQLHNGGGRAGMAMGVTLVSRDGYTGPERPSDKDWGLAITERMRVSGEDPALGRVANDPQSPFSRGGQVGYGRGVSPAAGAPSTGGRSQAADTNGDGTRRTGSLATWAGGAIDIGTRDKTTDRSKVTATTAGLSAGADLKLGEGIVVGVGGGYGNDLSRIGSGAQVRGTSTIYAAYASLQPADGTFIDGMVGRGQLDFTTRRIAAAVDAVARGSRDGSYTVAGVSLGVDRTDGQLQWSLYGRGEYMDADLDAYVETGAGRYNLRFDARQVRSLTGTIGARFQYRQKMSFGSVTPRVRAEWNHEFADVDAQWLDYADIPGLATYSLSGNGWKREQLQLSLGARFDILKGAWSFDFETGLRTGQGEKAGTLQLRVTKTF
ncbi:Ig-like domain-containing protein [Sphingomonas sp. HITSZ_GF]|uniref:Ig-like domain-containing protein n=1 Tax=Sphingomonas sp. HITSZ_GF TaxID=3037247 RepID=UPI00240D501B|nr:Ig-like domain-containing protein [Sphingomonas sp. HITSZ_GF]MDG2535816.1 Ig-like domain-containing protein [Sphingomonas sp. HITSZ_GF]